MVCVWEFISMHTISSFLQSQRASKSKKNLIQTLDRESSLVLGVEVPALTAHFTHQSTSGSQTINLTPESLPSSFRFKARILLSRDKHFVLFWKKKDFSDVNICLIQRQVNTVNLLSTACVTQRSQCVTHEFERKNKIDVSGL